MRITKLFYSFFIAASCFGATYQVSVNASSLPTATSGFIDFAFNGGYPATATISNFSNTGGSLNAATLYTQGTVTGVLPATVTMGDNNANYDEGIVYGSPISFLLTLSGTPSGNTGNLFTFSLFDTNFDGLLTGNTNDGWIVQFQMDTKGNITPTAYANPVGGPSLATVTAIPEPATVSFAAFTVGALFLRSRAKRHASRDAK